MSQNPLSYPDPWNQVAEGYAIDLLPAFELFAGDALRFAELSPPDQIIDVAAGPGTLSLLAAPRVASVEAIDFSEEMVRILAQRAAEAGHSNVTVQRGDGQKLPFGDATFDAAFSMFGLMFFPDRAAGFREMRRVLKMGGRAVVSSWAPMDQVPVLAKLFGAIGELLPGIGFGSGKAPLSEPTGFREEMEDAGFSQVEIRTVEHQVRHASMAEFWESQVRSSAPVALLKSRLDAEQWDVVSRDLVPRLEGEFGSGPIELTWPAFFGIALRTS